MLTLRLFTLIPSVIKHATQIDSEHNIAVVEPVYQSIRGGWKILCAKAPSLNARLIFSQAKLQLAVTPQVGGPGWPSRVHCSNCCSYVQSA
jgi:hypothetical protein